MYYFHKIKLYLWQKKENKYLMIAYFFKRIMISSFYLFYLLSRGIVFFYSWRK